MVRMLLWNLPLGLLLLVGFGLAVRNFHRHGRSARIALVGYLFVLMWLSNHVALLTLMAFPPRNLADWEGVMNTMHDVGMTLQFTAPPIGYAVLAWAVFAGRNTPHGSTP